MAVFDVGRTLFCVWGLRSNGPASRNIVRVLIWSIASAFFWVGGGFLDVDLRFGAWFLAICIAFIGPLTLYRVPGLGHSETLDWAIDGGHMAERTGLFVLMALGEYVLATGLGITELDWTPSVIAATAVTLVQAIAMWAIYFGRHSSLATGALASTADPGWLARRGVHLRADHFRRRHQSFARWAPNSRSPIPPAPLNRRRRWWWSAAPSSICWGPPSSRASSTDTGRSSDWSVCPGTGGAYACCNEPQSAFAVDR